MFNNGRLGLFGCTGQSPWARALAVASYTKRRPCL